MEKQPIFKNISLPLIAVLGCLFVIYFLNNYILDNKILFEQFSLYKDTYSLEKTYRFLTYGFLHLDFAHLLFNCIWLVIFGTGITQYYGFLRFLIIFMGGIIFGGLSHIALASDQSTYLIGASAGVTALCGAAMRFIMKIELDFRGKPLLLHLLDSRYLIIVAFFSLVDIAQALIQNHLSNTHIAWYAHLTGLLWGGLIMSIPFINKNALFRKKS